MIAFNAFDQSVPAPEFGAGASFRFTFDDLLELEKYAELQVSLMKSGMQPGDQNFLVDAVSSLVWVQNWLSTRKLRHIRPIIDIALKTNGGQERLRIDWSNPPSFSISEICNTLLVSLVASIENKTIEEVLETQRKQAADFEEALTKTNPSEAQEEVS